MTSRRKYKEERHSLLLSCCGSKIMLKGWLSKFLFLLSLIIFLSMIIAPLSVSAKTCEQWVAKAVSIEGRVEAKRDGETQWQQVQPDETFCAGDQVRVLDESRADLAFANQPLLRLDQNSAITLGGIEKEESSLAGLFKGAANLDLIKGAAHFFSRLPRNLEVRTAFVNAGVEGTEFFIKVADNKTLISVFEGKVLAANDAGNIGLTSGQSAVAEAGKAPVLRVVANPRDAVRWALHYPPVLDGPGPDALTNQAAQLLSVGRVDEAGIKIKQALASDPGNSNAFALQSIIAVVQNDKDAALNSANKAVAAGPESATAQIALSYAQQADFDLAGARSSLENAVKLEPENALAWARLAELQSSFGELDKALDAAQKAVELNPKLSRTQTVLGFAYLTQIKTAMAKEAFNKAIEQDQADALPRLGLGLAKIRDGELEDGRREIEIAASLDSNSSLIRSYLGKAYYEEKRTDLDGREYAIAKDLDPNDPTPWFYDAIRKQTINQPVEALHDLQTAIELNDNRAVYRSKLMLDSDLAARSASLARIYSDLGFQQRALVEGYNSVNTDPTNYSAHRFLADSYSALPRHEIARVSELLQSQLLQPNNITPIQPQLAESNLFLISSGGPANSSFREFNPLFNRDRVALQASGMIGDNSTNGGEAIVSGIYKKASFSAGYSHFETDGFRINNDQEDDFVNIFGQIELSTKTSIQAEYRYRDSDRGFLQLRFEPDDFLSDFREEEEKDVIRLGIRHAFSPASQLIGNFTYQDKDYIQRSMPGGSPPFPVINLVESKFEDEAYSGELQYLLRSERINLVTGAGYFDIDQQRISTLDIEIYGIGMPPTFPPSWVLDPFQSDLASGSSSSDLSAKHTNLYLYSYIYLPRNVMLTLGGSGDFFDSVSSEGPDVDQFNPKLGITWTPHPNTTVRGAAFRVLKRTLITDQTLEPTQVAGFNQFYDDADGTESRRYAAAIDQKFSKDIYGGAEFSKRDLVVPVLDSSSELDWDEKLFRAYLFWTPANWLAVTGEYVYEEFNRDTRLSDGTILLSDGALSVETNYVLLGMNFFSAYGLSASLNGTFVDQKGDFERYGVSGGTPGEDDFWLFDAAVSYRLPKRYGSITAGAKNLFDEEFQYFDTDRDNPRIIPDRFFFVRLTLAIP
ncbi:TonB-dependent receptor domain-containing protein [Thermodesulfobacteriota bacterium]